MNYELITILGPTATGKTRLAACLAENIGGEIISADSRQVYKGMDIGTGKDLDDYIVNGKTIPYHLIDIVDAGYEYSVYEYVNDFQKVYDKIIQSGKTPILCGGSGMYIEAVLKGYNLRSAPESKEFRVWSSEKTDEELIEILKSYRALHNVTDIKDRGRLERAVEITMNNEQLTMNNKNKGVNSIIFGVMFEREEIRRRITERLKQRLNNGMIEEVKELMDKGVSESKMRYYGLEYRYISEFLSSPQSTVNSPQKWFTQSTQRNKTQRSQMKDSSQTIIDRQQLFEKLNIAIHQFAKRQMTWFRRMEKNGLKINWIDGNLEIEKKLEFIINKLN